MVATRLGLELANRSDYELHMLFYKKPFLLENQENLPENLIFHEIERSGYALFRDIGSPFTIHSASSMAKVVKSEQIDIESVKLFLSKQDYELYGTKLCDSIFYKAFSRYMIQYTGISF